MLQKKKELHGEIRAPWSDDYLNTKKVADYLTPVIANISQPFVISLNAPYGTGKTYLIRNWQKQLSIDGYKAVYFNAWLLIIQTILLLRSLVL